MQELYGRHFLAPFGSFDAIPDQDQPAIDPHRAWKQPQHGPRPQGRKPIKLDAAAVKVIDQLGVEADPGPGDPPESRDGVLVEQNSCTSHSSLFGPKSGNEMPRPQPRGCT